MGEVPFLFREMKFIPLYYGKWKKSRHRGILNTEIKMQNAEIILPRKTRKARKKYYFKKFFVLFVFFVVEKEFCGGYPFAITPPLSP